jgi:hypothetical protein
MKTILLAVACASLAVSALGQAKPLAGAAGTIGMPAKLGPYLFTLVGVSFATRVAHVDDTAVADKGKKYLIINYTVQNPGKVSQAFDWASIHFTVVSAENANHENLEIVLNPEKMTRINLEIKPAQKVPAMTYVEVPATDPIPKLIAASGNGPVLRFDLKGKVKKYTGMYAAPDGITVLDVGNAKIGEKVELGQFDFTIEKVEESETAIGEVDLPEGQKLFVATIAFTNASKLNRALDSASYNITMKDTNGEPIEYRKLIRAIGMSDINQEIKAGELLRGRMLFVGPKEAKAASITMGYGEGRAALISLK